MARRLIGAIALAFAVGGCMARQTPPVAAPVGDPCGAAGLGEYRGQTLTPDRLARITAAAGARAVRTIRPGDAMTMDYREDRLNVELDGDGRIVRLRCG